ncbi:DUF3857 domain-containing transglutaminase family protein [Methylomonas sp. HYX-M1]|uniref:DUF3857 domain-containing transglutaminase family protein n=1 Tax=Methylomonas sp. HYX-M1 TaxID=3139307 RepID=UPI00345C08EA
MNQICVWVLLLSWTLPCLSGEVENKLRQIGYSANLLRWQPTGLYSSYKDLAPTAERMQVWEKAGYGSVAIGEDHQIKLLKSGQVEETITQTWLYLTTSGIESDGNLGLWFNADSQRVDILAAYVLQPGGTVASVEPNTLQINTDNAPNIFDDSLYVTIPLAQLKPGSIAVLRYRIVSARDKSPLPWARNLYTANFYPLERLQVDVHWDDMARKPAWRSDDTDFLCREERLDLHCVSRHTAAPQPVDNQMPAPQDVLPVLILAEPGDWSAISDRVHAIAESALTKNDKLDDEVARLTGGNNDQRSVFTRLASFVAREIRYVGLERGHGGVIPRPSLTTLERRFGDCKDKTMLFVDLARRAGLDAYPVLTSTKRTALNKLLLPSANYFNHMIACVKLSKGGEQCADLTDPETAGRHLPHSLQGAVALRLGRNGNAPHTLPREPYTWVARLKADNVLTEAGSVVETLARRYESHWAAGLRRVLSAKSKIESERWLLEDFQAVMGAQAEPTFSVQGLENQEAEMALNTTVEYQNLFTLGQLTSYQESDYWLRDLTKDAKTSNRHYPYQFKGIDYRSELSFRVPSGKHVTSVGPKMDYVSRWGSFHRNYRQDGETVTADTTLVMPSTEIPVDKMAEFNQYLDLVGYETRFWFSLKAGMEK